jgi:hypothetical protein
MDLEMQVDGARSGVAGVAGVPDQLASGHADAGGYPFLEARKVRVVVTVAVITPQGDGPSTETDIERVRPDDDTIHDRDEWRIPRAEDVGALVRPSSGTRRTEGIPERIRPLHGKDPVLANMEQDESGCRDHFGKRYQLKVLFRDDIHLCERALQFELGVV